MNAGQEKDAAITATGGDELLKAKVQAAEKIADEAFAASMMNANAERIVNEPEVALQAPKPRRRSRLSQTVKVYDSIDVIEVDGVRYTRGFFDMMNARPVGSIFRLVHRDVKSKAVTFEELPPSLKR